MDLQGPTLARHPPHRERAGIRASSSALPPNAVCVPLGVSLRPYPGRVCRHVMMAQAKWSMAR
jgi:hypothetical protein